MGAARQRAKETAFVVSGARGWVVLYQIGERKVQAGQILGIEVLDHVIIGDLDRSASMKEKGMM